MADQWSVVLIIVFTIQGMFVGGTTLLVMKHYAADPRWRHIAFVAASYFFLTLVTAYTAVQHPETWRLVVLGITYTLGDYALGVILRLSHGSSRGRKP